IETNAIEQHLRFIHLGDPHLVSDNCTSDGVQKFARHRRDTVFKQPLEHFQRVCAMMPQDDVDLLICTGDLIDFYEESQVDYAQQQLQHIPYPFYLTPGNHEFQDIRCDGEDTQVVDPRFNDNLQRDKKSAYWSQALNHDFPNWRCCHKGINFVGLDNADYTFSDISLELLSTVAADDKPYFVFSHVPVGLPTIKDRLKLIWGNSSYLPEDDISNQRFQEIICNSTNFLGSFVGHAHLRSDDQFGQAYQFITADTMSNGFREIIVRPL
ncbi:MAG: metallophosphoesterase, partial [Planctomycetes bacterium]|nr:metallophosphoesterase [Planctomycetota bacterium]